MSKKEVVKKGTTEVSTNVSADWGQAPVDTDSVIIPKLFPVQKSSKMIDSDQAKFGDIVSTLDHAVLGGVDNPIEIIPFAMYKTWLKTEGGQFVSVEPANNRGERRWEEGTFKNEFCMNFYCLVKGYDLPHVITFKGTSGQTGKQLYTQMYVTNAAAGLAPCAKAIELSTRKKDGDKGTYVVLSVSVGRDVEEGSDDYNRALKWFKTINTSEVKVAEEQAQQEFNFADSKEF